MGHRQLVSKAMHHTAETWSLTLFSPVLWLTRLMQWDMQPLGSSPSCSVIILTLGRLLINACIPICEVEYGTHLLK